MASFLNNMSKVPAGCTFSSSPCKCAAKIGSLLGHALVAQSLGCYWGGGSGQPLCFAGGKIQRHPSLICQYVFSEEINTPGAESSFIALL